MEKGGRWMNLRKTDERRQLKDQKGRIGFSVLLDYYCAKHAGKQHTVSGFILQRSGQAGTSKK
jgi:hypothetical protein